MWRTKRRRERDIAELAALADGSLDPARRAALEARVAASPTLQALLAEQRDTVAAIRGLDEPAPQRLHAAISSSRRRWSGLRPALAVGAAGAAALALLALPGGQSPPPRLASAVALGERPATSAGPVSRAAPRDREHAILHGASVGDIRFPDWKAEYGWSARGSRVDRFGKRRAKTVFYFKRGHRVAYTIFSGGPITIPASSRPARWEGKRRRVLRADGRVAVTWERRGHTCLVSGHGLRRRTLVKLTA